MRRLRYSIVAVLAALTFLFNLERLDLGEVNAIDISSFVYVIAFLMVSAGVAFRLVPSDGRWVGAVAAFWTAMYLLGKLLVFHDRPFWGGIHTYLTVTELAILMAVFLISQRLISGLREFEKAVATLTLKEVSREVRSVNDAREDIQDRILLSRRHHRPLSVLVFGVDRGACAGALHRIVEEVQRRMANRFVVATLANAIVRSVRRTDLPLEQGHDGRFVVLCPETDASGAATAARLVQRAVRSELGVEMNVGIAVFPGDALTFEELLRHAEVQLRKGEPGEQLAVSTSRV